MPDVFVYGDEDVKVLISQGKKLTIFFAAESRISNGFALVPGFGEKELHFPGQALVMSNLISMWRPS